MGGCQLMERLLLLLPGLRVVDGHHPAQPFYFEDFLQILLVDAELVNFIVFCF